MTAVAMYLLGALIVAYCLVAARYHWHHRRPVSWDYGRQEWRSSHLVREARRYR